MVGAALQRVLAAFRIAAVFGVIGLVLLAVAITVASLRYGTCGPSALDAANTACRTGAQLLIFAYALLCVALVAGATSLTLLWRLRRQPCRRG